MREHKFFVTILVVFSLILASCGVHYVEIENPSNTIEVSCFSFLLPAQGKWYKLWTLSNRICENRNKFVSGNETDLYWIILITNAQSWKDDNNAEYLLEKTEKFIESQRDALLNHKDYKDHRIDSVYYELNEVEGIKDITVKLKYKFSSAKPLAYSTGGLGYASTTTRYGENGLSQSDIYFYEFVEFHVIEGPYKTWLSREAIVYKVVFMHVSINENGDPELEAKALNFLKNLDVTVDWEKEVK